MKLLLLPSSSTRRDQNKTRYMVDGNAIMWQLDVNFPHAQAQFQTV